MMITSPATATLPNNKRSRLKALWLCVFAVNLIAVISIWWFGSSHYYITDHGEGNLYIALGRLIGLLMQYTILIQVVLIGRISFIEQAFGFDKMNRIHRLIGEWIIVLLVAHPLLLTIGTATQNAYTLWDQFGSFLAEWQDVFLAFIGASIFIYVASISYAIVRKKLRYELWYVLHLATYAAIVLVFFHELNTGDLASVSKPWFLWYWYVLNFSAFAFVITYRFLIPLWNSWRFAFRVEHVELAAKDTYSVYITGNNIGHFRFKPGQYANITFLQKGLWFTHPFSFSMEPDGKHIRFTMKALGDHTRRLGQLRPGTRVILDGPLGLFIEETAVSEKLLFIAGGIGITPIRSIIGELVPKKRDMVLIYGVRTLDDIAFRDEFASLQQQHPFPIHYILSTPTPGFESGYLDKEKLTRLVPDFDQRDVFLCGPPVMMDAAIDNLKDLKFKSIQLHYEKFSF